MSSIALAQCIALAQNGGNRLHLPDRVTTIAFLLGKENGDQWTDKDLQVVVKNGHGCACSSL